MPQSAEMDKRASRPAALEKLFHLVWIYNNATFCRCATDR